LPGWGAYLGELGQLLLEVSPYQSIEESDTSRPSRPAEKMHPQAGPQEGTSREWKPWQEQLRQGDA